MSDQDPPSLNDLQKLQKDIYGLFELIDPFAASYSLLITYREDVSRAINPKNDSERATRSNYDKWCRFTATIRHQARKRPSEVKARQPESNQATYEPKKIITEEKRGEIADKTALEVRSKSSAAAANPAVPEPQVEDQVSETNARQPQSHNRNASTSTFGTPKDPSKEYYSQEGSRRKNNPQDSTSFQRSNEATDEHTYHQTTQESGRNTATQHQGTMPPSASSHIAPGKVQRSASSGAPQSGKGDAQHTTSQHQTFPPNNPPGHIKRSASSGAPQSVQGFGEYTTSHTNSGNLGHNAGTNLQPPTGQGSGRYITGQPQAMPRPHASRTAAPPSSFYPAQVHGVPQAGYSSGPAPQAHGYMTGQHQAMSGSYMNVPPPNYVASSGVSSQGGSAPPPYQQQYVQQASVSAMPTGSSSSNPASGSRSDRPPEISHINGSYFDNFGNKVYRDERGVWRYTSGHRWMPK